MMYTVRPYLSVQDVVKRLDTLRDTTVGYQAYQSRYDYAISLGYSRGKEAQIYALLTPDEQSWLTAQEIDIQPDAVEYLTMCVNVLLNR